MSVFFHRVCMFKSFKIFAKHPVSLLLSRKMVPRFRKYEISYFFRHHCSVASHASRFLGGIRKRELENEFLHKVLECHSLYAESAQLHPLLLARKSGNVANAFKTHVNSKHPIVTQQSNDNAQSGVFDTFVEATANNLENELLPISHYSFQNMSSVLSQAIPSASDNEILRTLHCLCFWPPPPKTYLQNFKIVWNTLDEECTKRLENWSVDQKLLVADYWFHLKLSRITCYNMNMIKDLIKRCDTLTSHQVVQLMFYVNLLRSVPQTLLDALSIKLHTVVKEVSLKEIGLISVGFFKTETVIKNWNTLNVILDKAIAEVDTVDAFTIVGILKCLRKSFQQHTMKYYVPLIKKLGPNIERWDILAAIHSALLSCAANIFEPALLDCVAVKLQREISNTRLKDVCKLLQCSAHFNYNPPNEFTESLFSEILKKVREVECLEFPIDFIHVALFYAYLGKYHYPLLKKILSPSFIDHCCSIAHNNDLFFPIAVIDSCVEVECPDYTGPRLEKKYIKLLEQRRGNIPSWGGERKNILTSCVTNLTQTIHELYGEDDMCIKHILPHMFTPDIILRVNSDCNDNCEPLSSVVERLSRNCLLKPPLNEIWVCFVICGSFSYAFKSKQLCGQIEMKKRQLEKLGFKVVLLNFIDVPADENRRRIFITKRLEALGIGNTILLSNSG